MENLFMILVLAGIGGFFYFRKKEKKKRNISIAVAIVSLVLFGITSPDVEEENEEGLESAIEEPNQEQVIAEVDEDKEKEKEEEKELEKKEKEKEAEKRAQEEKERAEAEKKEKEEEEQAAAEAEEVEEAEFDPEDYNKDLTYDDLARNPDEHLFKRVTFEGKIIQVIQGDEYSQYRIATNDNYDKVMLLEIDSDQLDSRILEDDYIRFYGLYTGEITYESTLGGNITVPGVVVDRFEFK